MSATSASNSNYSSTEVSFPAFQEVSFRAVHEWVLRRIGHIHDGFPLVGAKAWFDLPDDDPLKEAAVIDAGQHWALRLELNQLALIESSQAIAAGWDWKGIAQELKDLNDFRTKNPWAKREAS